MLKNVGLVVIAAVLIVGGALIVKQRFYTDPLATVPTDKLTALDTAAKKSPGDDRNKDMDAAVGALKDEYTASSDKQAFVKAINDRLSKLSSTARVKGDDTNLTRDADATTPTGGSAPPSSGGGSDPTVRDSKLIKQSPLAVLCSDLLYHSRAGVSDFKVNLKVQPFEFSLTPDFLPTETVKSLQKETLEQVNRPPFKGRTIDKVTEFRFVLSKDMKQLTGCYVYFEGKDDKGQPLAKAGFRSAIFLNLQPAVYTPDACANFARQLISKIEAKHGRPDRGEIRYVSDLIVFDPVLEVK